tara:strand:- start:357 stop:689 length:333 start_codon:yes stop_codon:yes gene_type:complete
MSRYSNRIVAVNGDDKYQETLEERGVKQITQYTTPTFRRITDEQLNKLRYKKYVWTVGDRFWRLAQINYDDKSLWWVIARFNNKPTEAHISPGDEIKIPTDIIMARELLL